MPEAVRRSLDREPNIEAALKMSALAPPAASALGVAGWVPAGRGGGGRGAGLQQARALQQARNRASRNRRAATGAAAGVLQQACRGAATGALQQAG